MKLLVFTAKWCIVCKALDQSGILDRFAKENPEVKIVKVTLEDTDGKVIDEEGDRIFRQLKLKALPALVFLYEAGSKGLWTTGRVVAKHEGGITSKRLKQLYEAARRSCYEKSK